MILADTSVWVGHLKGLPRAAPLVGLLEGLEVALHPFVLGELVLGGLDADARGLLISLPAIPVATEDEVLGLVDENGLSRSGIGWVDAHLLASCRLASVRLWTADRSLDRAAAALGVDWAPR